MSDNQKSGFVLYFNNCECLDLLSPDQRGELFTALIGYAEASVRGATPLDYLERCPELQSPAQVAFLLIAGNIQRDTEKWKRKRERFREAAAKRQAAEKPDDMASLRRIIRQREKEEDA